MHKFFTPFLNKEDNIIDTNYSSGGLEIGSTIGFCKSSCCGSSAKGFFKNISHDGVPLEKMIIDLKKPFGRSFFQDFKF